MKLTALLTPAEEGRFVAFNPETGTTSKRQILPESISNLGEATLIYLEDLALKPSSLVPTFDGCHPKPDAPGS